MSEPLVVRDDVTKQPLVVMDGVNKHFGDLHVLKDINLTVNAGVRWEVQLPFYAWLAEAAAAYLPINETPVVPLELDGETDVDAISRRLPELLEAIASGAGLPAAGIDAVCAHCEARGLCRKGMWHE